MSFAAERQTCDRQPVSITCPESIFFLKSKNIIDI